MVWILFLSDTDVSTRALTTMKHLHAFGVYQDLIGGEALASNQSLYLMQTIIMLHLNAFRGVRAISKFDWSFAPTHNSSRDFSTSIGSALHSVLPKLQPGHHLVSRPPPLTIRLIRTRFRFGSIPEELNLAKEGDS